MSFMNHFHITTLANKCICDMFSVMASLIQNIVYDLKHKTDGYILG